MKSKEVNASILKALVIRSNEKINDLGSLLAIARAEACRREGVRVNPPVRALVFVAELGCLCCCLRSFGLRKNG